VKLRGVNAGSAVPMAAATVMAPRVRPRVRRAGPLEAAS